jgi:large subunit ribosomal protein L25
MAEITLAAEIGRPLGTRAARRLRRGGQIPGIVYGHGTEPLPVAVGARELRVALSGESGSNALLSLVTEQGSYLTLARDIQRHPVRQTVTHVDFVIVRRDEVIAAEVPVTLVGEAIEVQRGDGLVEQQLFTLSVHAVPADIPAGIEVDISELVIGGSVRVADIVLASGVSTDVDGESAIVVGQPPRVQLEAEEEGAEEPEAGAEASAPESAASEDTSDEG